MIWLMISGKSVHEVHVSSLWCKHAPSTKSLKQGIQKNCITKFSILSALKLPSCGVVVFIDMNTFLYLQKTEHFFCLLFTKEMLIMELNIILIVLMEFA